jgi:hypothetical protein
MKLRLTKEAFKFYKKNGYLPNDKNENTKTHNEDADVNPKNHYEDDGFVNYFGKKFPRHPKSGRPYVVVYGHMLHPSDCYKDKNGEWKLRTTTIRWIKENPLITLKQLLLYIPFTLVGLFFSLLTVIVVIVSAVVVFAVALPFLQIDWACDTSKKITDWIDEHITVGIVNKI